MGLRNAPLIWLFAAAWAGCWLGRLRPTGPIDAGVGWAIAAVIASGWLAFASRRLLHARIYFAALSAALACAVAVTARLERHEALESRIVHGTEGVIAGRIVDVTGSPYKGFSIRLRPDHMPEDVELVASPGEVRRALASHPIGADGRVAWPVRLYPYRRPGNPGEFDGWMRAAQRGLVSRAYFAEPIVDPIWLQGGESPDCLTDQALRSQLSAVRLLAWRWRCTLTRALSGEAEQVAIALVLGQRDRLSPESREAFSKAGIAHLLSVSGVHVGFVAMAALAVLGSLVSRPRRAWLRMTALPIGAALIGSYVLLVDGPPSALRSGLMSAGAFAAQVVGRRSNSFQSLGAAGLTLLFVEPLFAFDLGFQLSFGATAGVLAAVRICRRALDRLRGMRKSIVWGMTVSCTAQAVTLPLAAGAFSTFSWLSTVVNLAAIPLAAGAILLLASGLVVSEVSDAAAVPFFAVGGLFIQAIIWLARWVSPWSSIEVSAPDLLFSYGWYALMIGAVEIVASCRAGGGARSIMGGRVLAVIGAGLLAVSYVGGALDAMAGRVHVWVLDVGQGDSILILGPWGKSVLVDGGPAGSGGYDAGADRVVPTLKRLGVRTIDVVVNSHPDRDHSGGLAEVVRQRNVGSVFASWAVSDTEAYSRFVKAVEAKGLKVKRFEAGDIAELGGHAWIRVLASGSLDEWDPGKGGIPATNDRSVALSLEVGASRFLLLGDVDERGVGRLMERHALQAEGLVIPHHGSPGDFWEAFFNRVDPVVAAVSVGPNGYGHPSQELMRLLARRGVDAARTDLCGAVRFDIDQRSVTMHPFRARDCKT